MSLLSHMASAALVCVTCAFSAQAGNQQGKVTDQRYAGGKYTPVQNTAALANCPREMRGMYRGELYCRTPTYQLIAQQRDPACPKDVWGLYRGTLYCFGQR